MDKCRKNHVTDKMLGFIKKNFKLFIYKGDKEGSFLYPDQDLINIVLIDDLKTLPQRWNNQNILGTYMTKLNDGGVLHYIGPVKPWHMNKAFSNDFAIYQRIQVSIATFSLSFVRFNARQNFLYISESTVKQIFFSILHRLSKGTIIYHSV